MIVNPMRDLVLLRKLKAAEEILQSGIVLPAFMNELRGVYMQGEICAVGPEVLDPHYTTGSVVFHWPYDERGHFEQNGDRYYFIIAEQALAINVIDSDLDGKLQRSYNVPSETHEASHNAKG